MLFEQVLRNEICEQFDGMVQDLGIILKSLNLIQPYLHGIAPWLAADEVWVHLASKVGKSTIIKSV